jgi:transcriptional regulator with XRE-family HTH domain
MPKRRKLVLPPLKIGGETIGKRLSRFRKERGYTQKELAKKIGITHNLVSDYETGRLMPNGEMVVRLAIVLNVTSDEILGLKPGRRQVGKNPSLKIVRRLDRIASMPPARQKAFLQTIDALLKVQGG